MLKFHILKTLDFATFQHVKLWLPEKTGGTEMNKNIDQMYKPRQKTIKKQITGLTITITRIVDSCYKSYRFDNIIGINKLLYTKSACFVYSRYHYLILVYLNIAFAAIVINKKW